MQNYIDKEEKNQQFLPFISAFQKLHISHFVMKPFIYYPYFGVDNNENESKYKDLGQGYVGHNDPAKSDTVMREQATLALKT